MRRNGFSAQKHKYTEYGSASHVKRNFHVKSIANELSALTSCLIRYGLNTMPGWIKFDQKMNERKVKNSIKLCNEQTKWTKRDLRAWVGYCVTAALKRDKNIGLAACPVSECNVHIYTHTTYMCVLCVYCRCKCTSIRQRISYPTAIITFHNSFAWTPVMI